ARRCRPRGYLHRHRGRPDVPAGRPRDRHHHRPRRAPPPVGRSPAPIRQGETGPLAAAGSKETQVNQAFPAPPLRWVIAPPPDEGAVAVLVAELNLPRPLAALLVERGHDTPEAARKFLRPALADLSDPYALSDMGAAVETIVGAVRRGEGILVHGDYDVDGQCATAVLTRALRAAGATVTPFVPHRLRDGYD